MSRQVSMRLVRALVIARAWLVDRVETSQRGRTVFLKHVLLVLSVGPRKTLVSPLSVIDVVVPTIKAINVV